MQCLNSLLCTVHAWSVIIRWHFIDNGGEFVYWPCQCTGLLERHNLGGVQSWPCKYPISKSSWSGGTAWEKNMTHSINPNACSLSCSWWMMMVGYSYKLCAFVIECMHVCMYIEQHCMKKANKFIVTEWENLKQASMWLPYNTLLVYMLCCNLL